MLYPAQHVITKCGGPAVVAEMAKRHISRVVRWTWPPERGGTGGTIPTQVHQRLIDEAKKRGIKLTPDDFFARAPKRRAS